MFDGNSEIGAHVLRKIGSLICLRQAMVDTNFQKRPVFTRFEIPSYAYTMGEQSLISSLHKRRGKEWEKKVLFNTYSVVTLN